MTHRRVVANALEYDYAPDDAPLMAHRDWAIACAQIVDDIGGAPLARPFHVRIELPGAQNELAQDGTRVVPFERGIGVKTGADGTFALVARPWLRFTPFAAPSTTTVVIEAAGFVALRHTFSIAYDQRTITVAAPAAGERVLTLDSTVGLVAGQTLLFGPAATPQYVRIHTIGGANQVTLETGLLLGHGLGEVVFPDVFAAPPAAVLALRRAPVRIVGRVVTRDTAANLSTAISNASITVSDFWRTRAAVAANPTKGAMTHPNPALRQFAIAVAPGALSTRAAGAGAGALGLPPAIGDDRLLVRPAAGEGTRIDVASGQNLQSAPAPFANRLLLVEPADPDAAEYQTIATVQPVGTPEEPARIELELPLRRGHHDGTPVTRIDVPGALPPTPRVLRDAAAPGDRCLFLDELGGLPVAGALRLTGGGPVDEFQRYAQLWVLSDAEGYFRLPPLQRIARVALTVDAGAGKVQTIEIDPEYGESEHRVDVVYPV